MNGRFPILRRAASYAAVLLLLLTVRLSSAQTVPTESSRGAADATDFFEAKIRPILTEHCIACHGPKEQSGGLRLDSRDAVLRGGEQGAVVTLGDPGKSRLVAAVRRQGDLQMPPDDPLSPQQIEALIQWIAVGAPWPAAVKTIGVGDDEIARTHWAFQPVRDPAVPPLQDASPATNPIDAFVLARLNDAGLGLSPPADARTLIRRATFDLTGLPPTPEEVAAVEEECRHDADAAYERLVERLLASPHYGEQWARHWLDVARYSDTKGYVYAREERFWVHAWVYRDWIVRSLNDDMPYDRFLTLQLAADQIAGDDKQHLAAMGFLTLGRRFLGVTHDIIDDRIDVVTRGMLGLTVACARCHDHKYDPIPTQDYYSLYGVFQNCAERLVPLGDAADDKPGQDFEAELAKRQQKLADETARARREAAERVRSRVGDYLRAQLELQKYPDEGFDQILAKEDIIPAFVRHWQKYLTEAERQGDAVFAPWHVYARIEPDAFASQATAALALHSAAETNPLVAQQFSTPPGSMDEVCRRYADLLARIDGQWQAAVKEAAEQKRPAPTELADPSAEALRRVLYGPGSPCEVPDEPIVQTESFFDSGDCTTLWKLQGDVDRHLIQSAAAPAHAVILVDRAAVSPAYVFRRGKPSNKGELAPPRFLSALSQDKPNLFQNGSGRLELARRIAHRDNPLTARVMVNRVWMHHFGSGLVRTPSDFGTRAEAPSHPELLDWLATRFVEEGWSLKQLHRRIMLSRVYRQSSLGPADAAARKLAEKVDPENRLLWRASARRLSFEEMRDALLAVSGQLDLTAGGKPANLFADGFRRRTLYGLIDRQFLPNTLRVFDFANPDLHIPERSETTAPQQALFFLNHPLLLAQAKALAASSASEPPQQRVQRMLQAAYQRSPTPREIEASLALVRSADEQPTAESPATMADWHYGYGEYDDSSRQLRGFTPLPHFTGSAWQGGAKWPDAKLGWVQLTADGGHAGNDLKHAAVRRWIAPTDMSIKVDSLLSHEIAAGDGIRGFLVHSGTGLLKAAEVHNSQARFDAASLAVKAGDTLDFVVDIGKGLNNDQFIWQAEITPLSMSNATPTTWQSSRDFGAQPVDQLGPWEQLAQVLLAANEFVFVD